MLAISMCVIHTGPHVAGQTLLELDAVTLQTPDGRSTLVQNLSVKVGPLCFVTLSDCLSRRGYPLCCGHVRADCAIA